MPAAAISSHHSDSFDNFRFPIFFLTHPFNMLNYLEVEFVMKFT